MLVVIAAASATVGLAACGHQAVKAAPTPAPTTATPTPTPTPTPTRKNPVVPALRSPLTGLPVKALEPVVAVKVDNVGSFGQSGLDSADVVYCEEVEGGLTRLLAVFSSTPAAAVGPVRSARESDLELLGEYGRIALAFSGANSGVLAEVNAANVRNDSYDDVTSAYSMDYNRPAPYSFLVNAASLAARQPGDLAKDVGFRFGVAPAQAVVAAAATAGALPPGAGFSVRYPAAVMSGTYSAGVYAMSRNGSALLDDGRPTTTVNVLLQYVVMRQTGYTDHNGVHTPFAETVGSGQALLLRGGREYTGHWSRATQTAPTTWTAAGGGALRLAAGRTWVLLVPVGSTVS